MEKHTIVLFSTMICTEADLNEAISTIVVHELIVRNLNSSEEEEKKNKFNLIFKKTFFVLFLLFQQKLDILIKQQCQ